MSKEILLETILQETSDNKIEWRPFNSYPDSNNTTLSFYGAQHLISEESVYCIYEESYVFLLTFHGIDFTRNSIISQLSLISLKNDEETRITDDQRKLHELKSLIFLNSLS